MESVRKREREGDAISNFIIYNLKHYINERIRAVNKREKEKIFLI
jgi:hypothetical protein